MRMTIRPKKPQQMDMAAILDGYLKQKGVKKSIRDELGPTLVKLNTDRHDLARVQTNNIRACDLLHKYLEQIRMVVSRFAATRSVSLLVHSGAQPPQPAPPPMPERGNASPCVSG